MEKAIDKGKLNFKSLIVSLRWILLSFVIYFVFIVLVWFVGYLQILFLMAR